VSRIIAFFARQIQAAARPLFHVEHPALISRIKNRFSQCMESENTTISLYENSVPPFAQGKMERLYENLYSSVAHYRIYGGIPGNASTYIAQKNGNETAVLLFLSEKNKVHVLNEQISIDAGEIDRFARYIFTTFRSVDVISFHAIEAKIEKLPFPYQQFNCTEDVVMTLPDTAQEYLASLGKATRSYINRYLNKIRRSFPTFSHNVYLKEEASERHIREIIGLNRARMAGKNKLSYIDDAEAERIIKLVKLCGLVSVMTIDGRICAGAINCRVGAHYFLKVIAHDPEYNEYRLGTLCCYLAICECIAHGGRQYHFLWGRYEYKYRLLGVNRNLDHIAVYRSPVHMVLNAGMALQLAFNKYLHRVRCGLQDRARRPVNVGLASRLVFHFLNYLRSLKQYASGLLARRR
jgi:hypothetical protein